MKTGLQPKRARKAQVLRENRTARLAELLDRILDATTLSSNDMKTLRDGQGFSTPPRLALAYFHCCAQHPDAFAHNDEHLRPPNGNPGERGSERNGRTSEAQPTVEDRLLRVLDDPPGQEEAIRCQQSVQQDIPGDIAACALCCEIITNTESCAMRMKLSELPVTFKATPQERKEWYGGVPDGILNEYCQVVVSNGNLLYINPDLVVCDDEVVLCKTRAVNPRSSPFSIACGHDYGRSGNLPQLNEVATNCISPVRRFWVWQAHDRAHYLLSVEWS
ncbi:hypothetical protein PHYSODRAFT_306619 [Phytophthora sojae]|uniref:Uncharacterized protein n=1 Tax=Phytophthora sojae (strain P6497) TaxID=1094619 RepID=G5AA18_PHYSP|nr:hypothetical protein PHYSODRAFT_306619 [Phytophthora sojae]EGZ07447.1 hypothetical protein PHYSODRAFT_306619 [Phytophthora sojae]|eukprot:XP_009537013.1 hypothetical protein PHYSODRAFT_306619 [Phytophthora sojae]